MIDFIDYVVSELKSKRLSKQNALALVRQYSLRSGNASTTSVIHPLLHSNTSDLNEQRYTSTFTGEEFFLFDHQVALNGMNQKVLPGVAYLEMARAAIDQAWPARPDAAILELRNTMWAQPLVVDPKRQVSIALTANDDDQIESEVYSRDAGKRIVHCRRLAVWSREAAPATLDLEQLKGKLQQGRVEPAMVYTACAQMGPSVDLPFIRSPPFTRAAIKY